MRAFIDKLDFIKVFISPDYELKNINVVGNGYFFNPVNIETERDNQHLIISLFFDKNIPLNKDLNVCVNDELNIPLEIGCVTKTDEFNNLFYYDGILGPIYSKDKTTFKVWSPVAKEIKLKIENEIFDLTCKDNQIWETTVYKDLLNCKYTYLVRTFNKFVETIDPYSYKTTINHKQSVICELKKCDDISITKKNNNLIYELSIRDATSLKLGGTFKDLIKNNQILEHIKSLNTSHIELLPVYGFGGIDEENYQNYNWGYNPVSYFSLSNYLSKDKTKSIEEFVKLVNCIHSLDMGVILDVVFNHVYKKEEFSYEILVPGYSYFYSLEGKISDASGCGNDLNTLHLMIRKLIIDNILYFVDHFKIDGLRFDLMGLLDESLIEEIYKICKKINPNFLILGEGWNIPCSLHEKAMNLSNAKKHPNISFFNDTFRDTIKGKSKDNFKGISLNDKISHEHLYNLFIGCKEIFDNPCQSVNYCECHDNYTFIDEITLLDKTIIDPDSHVLLSLAFTIMSFGLTFISEGQELKRSKKKQENSYNKSDFINGINWDKIKDNKQIINMIKYLTGFKNNISVYNINNYEEIMDHVKLSDYSKSFNISIFDKTYEYILIFKNNIDEETVSFDDDVTLILNVSKEVNLVNKMFTLKDMGLYIIKK